jgi:tripartite-type tricarboxylate transporter receptor subunit TctC
VLERLNAAFAAALASPSVAEWLREAGATPVAGPPERFAAFLASERPRWAALVRENNVSVD